MAKTFVSMMICAVLFGGGAACSATSSSPSNSERNEDSACVRLVENYVAETRGWKEDDYEVREESSDLGGRGFEVWHASDNRRPKPPGGEGKSFRLEVDADCQKVVKELAYQ